MALDDNYVYPTCVALNSLLESSSENTSYEVTVMIPDDFKSENKQKIMSVYKKYNKNHKINFYNMKNAFKKSFLSRHIKTPTYYRLKLPSVLRNKDKCIWLDGDTLIFNDLAGMNDINLEDNYLAGVADHQRLNTRNLKRMQKLGACDNKHYVCAGVMLLNLKKMREDNIQEKLEEFVEKKNSQLVWHDQDTLNVICYDKILDLPPEFGVFNYYLKERVYEKNCIARNCYNKKDWEKAVSRPSVVHMVFKPWGRIDKVIFEDKWWECAARTPFFEEIKKWNENLIRNK